MTQPGQQTHQPTSDGQNCKNLRFFRYLQNQILRENFLLAGVACVCTKEFSIGHEILIYKCIKIKSNFMYT